MTKIIAFLISLLIVIPQITYAEDVSYSVRYMEVSAYTPHDSGTLTASGDEPIEGVTVAMNGVPLGTIIEIDGKQYIVQDRCGVDNRVDIFMESYDDAIEWGVRHKEIIVYH